MGVKLPWFNTHAVNAIHPPSLPPGKNNSLLDAVSLYMWGVCDADSVLHAALYRTLAESSAAELRLAALRRAARYTSAHLPPDSGVSTTQAPGCSLQYDHSSQKKSKFNSAHTFKAHFHKCRAIDQGRSKLGVKVLVFVSVLF